MKQIKRPKLNIVANIVNNHFLDSDYQGKDWEEVRKSLIKELGKYFKEIKSTEITIMSKTKTNNLELKKELETYLRSKHLNGRTLKTDELVLDELDLEEICVYILNREKALLADIEGKVEGLKENCVLEVVGNTSAGYNQAIKEILKIIQDKN